MEKILDPITNFGYSTVATAPSPAGSGTSLVLASGEGSRFPDPSTDGSFNIVIYPDGEQPLPSNSEIVRVTARSSDTLTITREQESTSARTIEVGDQVSLPRTERFNNVVVYSENGFTQYAIPRGVTTDTNELEDSNIYISDDDDVSGINELSTEKLILSDDDEDGQVYIDVSSTQLTVDLNISTKGDGVVRVDTDIISDATEALIHVDSGSNAYLRVDRGGTPYEARLEFAYGGTVYNVIKTKSGTPANHDLYITDETNDLDFMRFKQNGNVQVLVDLDLEDDDDDGEVALAATGSETDIDINIAAKGDGWVNFGSTIQAPLLQLTKSSADAYGSSVVLNKRGDSSDADNAIDNNAELGYVQAYGWDGDSYEQGGFAGFWADEDWNASSNGTRYVISHKEVGSTSDYIIGFQSDNNGITLKSNSSGTHFLRYRKSSDNQLYFYSAADDTNAATLLGTTPDTISMGVDNDSFKIYWIDDDGDMHTFDTDDILGSNSFNVDQSGGTSDTYGSLSGTINGSNTTFTVSDANGYISGSLLVYLNGQLQTQGTSEDWDETTPASGTFDFNTAPESGDEITVYYKSATSVTGNADTVDGYEASALAKTADMPTGDVVGTTDTQTITNKTIDGDDNTLQDIDRGSLKTPHVKVVMTSDMTNVSTGSTVAVQFNSVIFGDSSDFNTSTYKYTVPETGLYYVSAATMLNGYTADGGCHLDVFVNDSSVIETWRWFPTNQYDNAVTFGLLDLDEDDTVHIEIYLHSSMGSGTDISNNNDRTHFEIFRIG